MSRLLKFGALFILVFFFVFTGLAFAANSAVPEDGSLLDLLKPVYEAFTSGHYLYAGSLSVVLLVAILRRYGSNKLPWFGSDEGGAVLTLVGSFAGAIATSLAGGSPVSLTMAWTALSIAVGAAGGYVLIKKLVVDRLTRSQWYQEKAPAWMKSLLGLVLWIFENHAKKPPAITRAEAAGEEAVKKDPPKGMGEVTELK